MPNVANTATPIKQAGVAKFEPEWMDPGDRIAEVLPTKCCSFCDGEVEDICETCRKPFCWNHGQKGGGFKYGIEGAPSICAECYPEPAR